MRLSSGNFGAGKCAWTLAVLVLGISGASAAMAQDAGDPTPASDPGVPKPYVAMTSQERWHDYIHDNFTGAAALAGFFASAAIGQLGRDPREWGEGAPGYWHRVGNHMGRAAIRGSIQSGLAAAMHYDTRYHRMPGHNGWSRAGHALRRTLFTQDEHGHTVFDVPGVAGIYGADMLSTYWHPRRYTPFGSGLHGGNFGLGFEAVGNLGKEFGPDLKHLLLRK